MSERVERRTLALVGPGWPLRGGIAQYTARLADELAPHHRVMHVSYARQYPGLFFPGTTQLDGSPRPAGAMAQPILDSLGPLSWRAAAKAIASFRASHAVLMWWHPFFAPCLGTLARLLARRGIPSTFLCHNVAPHEGSRLTRLLSRWAFAPASSFIVHAAVLEDALRELAPAGAPIAVSPLPLYDQFGPPRETRDARAALGVTARRVLLFFGLVRAYKGISTLIEAFALLAARDPEVALVIAGECYEPEATYRKMIAAHGLAGRVHFENRFVPNEMVATYFGAADVVVLPYHTASQSAVVPIAYAMDRPVVVTRVGGLPEAVHEGEAGHLVPPRDPEALAAAIVLVLERGPEAYRAGLSRGRARLSWSRMRETVERLAGGGPLRHR